MVGIRTMTLSQFLDLEKQNEENNMKYRKKPVVVDAMLFNGTNHQAIYDFSENKVRNPEPNVKNYAWLKINTLEGEMDLKVGWWIIKGIKGEFYAIEPEIFKQTYEKV